MAAHELGADLGAWNALVRRARITDRQKLAALVVSSYADPDGTGIHCGVTRLAVDLGVSYRTAQRYLSWLRQVGLLELVREGNRRRRLSDVYRLIIGPDILEHFEVLDPGRYDEMRTDLRDARSGRRDQASPKNDAQSAPESDAPESDQASPRVSYKDSDQASNSASSGVTQGVPPPSNITFPNRSPFPADDEDLGTDVTGPREADEDPKPDSSARPAKCPEHGLGGGLRPDGKPECTLCRVVGPKPGGPSDPDPDPPPDRTGRCDHTPLPGKDRCRICAPKPIAPVIRIDSRRTA
jgi:DNA-binding transcriptional ArsR family regulator